MDADVIVVGAGLAGAALATSLARHGTRVLVLEREEVFRDRVRGEGMAPWGVAEARALGLAEVILARCGQELGWTVSWDASVPTPERRRDLIATTAHRAGFFAFAYPDLQRVLLETANAAGADVWQGARVVSITPGRPPTVLVRRGEREATLRAQFVVGADGRESRLRAWGGFAVERDPDRLFIASVLLRGGAAPRDAVRKVVNPPIGQAVLIVPLGQDRVRPYLMYRTLGARKGLSGAGRLDAFIQTCLAVGSPPEWFAGAERDGPLAEFAGAHTWATHPYRDGVALIGDAAGTSDPSFGNGLSLSLRDARVLRDQLLAHDDWGAAGHAYAAAHDQYFGALRRLERWWTDLMHEVGPEADALRARVFPRLKEEPDRAPDLVGVGPDAPSDEQARRRFFAEE